MSTRIKHKAVEFLTHKNETPMEIRWLLLAFYGKDRVDISTVRLWVRKSWESSGNPDLNEQPRSGRPVSATHDLNRQEIGKLTKNSTNFADSHSGNVKRWFS